MFFMKLFNKRIVVLSKRYDIKILDNTIIIVRMGNKWNAKLGSPIRFTMETWSFEETCRKDCQSYLNLYRSLII